MLLVGVDRCISQVCASARNAAQLRSAACDRFLAAAENSAKNKVEVGLCMRHASERLVGW